MCPQNFAYLSPILRVAWYQLDGALNFGRAVEQRTQTRQYKNGGGSLRAATREAEETVDRLI